MASLTTLSRYKKKHTYWHSFISGHESIMTSHWANEQNYSCASVHYIQSYGDEGEAIQKNMSNEICTYFFIFHLIVETILTFGLLAKQSPTIVDTARAVHRWRMNSPKKIILDYCSKARIIIPLRPRSEANEKKKKKKSVGIFKMWIMWSYDFCLFSFTTCRIDQLKITFLTVGSTATIGRSINGEKGVTRWFKK